MLLRFRVAASSPQCKCNALILQLHPRLLFEHMPPCSLSLAALNGYVYRSLPGLTMCKNDKVSWHLSGLGSEPDIHSLYFYGNRFLYRQTRRDSISVFPHISHTVIMEPDSMGKTHARTHIHTRTHACTHRSTHTFLSANLITLLALFVTLW